MKTKLFVTLTTVILLAFSYTADSKTPGKYTDVPISELQWKLPEYQIFKLDNDIECVLVNDPEVPMIDFYFKFTAPPDPSDKVGLAEITAWALRQGGTESIPGDSLNDLIEFTASSLYIWTEENSLSIWGNCLSSEISTMLSLVRELIDNPLYPQDKIALKKSTMLEEIRRKNDQPQWIASREFYKLVYPNHPWGWEASESSIESVARSDLIEYHSKVFCADGTVIGFSGDLSFEQAQSLTSRFFGHLNRRNNQLVQLPPLPEPSESGVYYGYKDVNQAYIYIGHRSIAYDNPSRISAEIMNYILGGGGFQSILTKRIRVDAGLSYAVGSRFTTPVEGEGVFRAGASTRLNQSGQTLELMSKTISEFAKNGPSLDEFTKARDSFVNSYVWKYESSGNILGRLVYLKWRNLPLDTPQLDLAAYQRLTLDDVKRASRELLHPDKLIIVIVGDQSKMERPLEDFGKIRPLNYTTQ